MKIAVIIPAYKTGKYILHTLLSMAQQKFPRQWHLNVRVGVDGCKETAAVLKKRGVPFYMNHVNAGVGIMRNSLIALGPADMYLIFDSDDIMLPGYIDQSVKAAMRTGACRPLARRVDERLRNKKMSLRAMGAITLTHDVLRQVGGYREYRIFEDRDFYERIAMTGTEIIIPPGAMFLRRSHPDSITRNKHKMDQEYVQWTRSDAQSHRSNGIIYVEPKTVEMEYIK